MNFNENSKSSVDLPHLQPRHLASLEKLTCDDLEANLRDYEKLEDFQCQQIKSKQTFECTYKESVGEYLLGKEILTLPFALFDVKTLEYFARKRSVTARQLYDSWRHLENVMAMIERIQSGADIESIINELAKCYCVSDAEIGQGILLTRKVFKLIAQVGFHQNSTVEKSQLDKDTRICLACNMVDLHTKVAFLEKCIEKYPDEIFFHISLCRTHAILHDVSNTTKVADTALEKFPNNCQLLKTKVLACYFAGENKECLDTCLKLLEAAPSDFLHLSEMYYIAASSMLQLRASPSMVEQYFQWGLQAEEERLPFLKPVDLDAKNQLQQFLKAQYQSDESGAKVKHELLNYFRVILIRQYREELRKIKQGLKIKARKEPKMRRRKIPPFKKIQFVTLDEFVKKKTSSFKCGIRLFVVEEAVAVKSVVRLVAEDETGQVVQVFVKNANGKFARKFRFASKIAVFNPYIWINDDAEVYDEKMEIWVGGKDCVTFENYQTNRCRFCWRKNSFKKFGNCKKCYYCCNECQEMDWLILNQDFMCEN